MRGHSEFEKLNSSMPDGGPVYTETDLSHIIAEPWNAVSSLALILPGVYWLLVLRGRYKSHLFLICCSLLLALGGLGSTIFHAFRRSPLFLYLDFMPIVILIYCISIYFQLKVLTKWWYVLIIITIDFALRYLLFTSKLPMHYTINLSYFISGVMIFTPLMFFLVKTHFANAKYVLYSVFLLSTALFFRAIDSMNPPLLPMGTHWMWHLFCSAGALYLGKFLYTSAKYNAC